VTKKILDPNAFRLSYLPDGCPIPGIWGLRPSTLDDTMQEGDSTELSALADDLNEVSVLLNVAHRLLLTIRDDVEASATLQAIVDDLNAAHDQLDLVLDHLATAIDQADAQAAGPPREQRPTIH
jgi:hypothetical protein